VTLLCLLTEQPEIQADMADPSGWLGVSERERLQALGSPARRESFLAGRWLARRAVQRWQGRDVLPTLEVATSGACRVVGERSVHVSISHSAGFVASAVAAVPVGVDIESLARPRDHLALARSVHGAEQCRQLEALLPDKRALPFVQWWTLKEAWLKARGQGLDFALMRSLAFEDEAEGDVAVADCGGLVLAIAADPALPLRIDGPLQVAWQRLRSAVSSA
jgi:4'-phosphopantetheinyl transferase